MSDRLKPYHPSDQFTTRRSATSLLPPNIIGIRRSRTGLGLEGATALRKSTVFATGLGDQNMVVEDVSIETETSRARNPVTSERGVGVCGAAQGVAGRPLLAVPAPLPRLRQRGWDATVAHPGRGHHQGVSAGRGPAGGMCRARGGGGCICRGRGPALDTPGYSRTPAPGWPRQRRKSLSFASSSGFIRGIPLNIMSRVVAEDHGFPPERPLWLVCG